MPSLVTKTLVLAVIAGITIPAVSAAGFAGQPQMAQVRLAKQKQVLRLPAKAAMKALRQVGGGGATHAIDITCTSDDDTCATDFVAACDRKKGGLSTNPDGSVTCSFS